MSDSLETELNLNKLKKIATNLYLDERISIGSDQKQTMDSFSYKWNSLKSESESYLELDKFQQDWFLKLYGFDSEEHLRSYLKSKTMIIDAGAGKGYKAAWIAKLAPHAKVFAIDISESVVEASQFYSKIPNLCFVRGDIGKIDFFLNKFDFVYCDQVIMHTEDPRHTFNNLVALVKDEGDVLTYVYRKKALPRELLDDHFRKVTHQISDEEMLVFSRQLTEMGKILSEKFPNEIEFPSIDALGIKAGKMTVQRFIYWNFMKCFWNEKFGYDLSVLTNFDWYSPSQASRYSKEEFLLWLTENKLQIAHFHEEEACYSVRAQV